MKKFLIIFLSLVFFTNSVSAHSFSSKSKSEVIKYDGENLELKITNTKDDTEVYPAGSVLVGTVIEHKPTRRCMRDEVIVVKLSHATLPNGTREEINREIKIKPRSWLSTRQAGGAAIVTAGGVLALTIDMLTIGLPVARGGKAIWEAGWELHDAEKGHKLKAGTVGFIKGALFPVPDLILKGKKLNIPAGSTISIHSADADDRVTGVIVH